MPRAAAVWLLLLALAAAVWLPFPARADEVDHLYKPGDRLVLWVNNVGPYNNPQESYKYFSLPWCTRKLDPQEAEDASLERLPHIGEVLHGVDHVYSRLPMYFKRNAAEIVCRQTLTELEAIRFDIAVRKQWWYQMHLDDLPVWGMVGEVVREDESTAHTQIGAAVGLETYIYTHKGFVISYNGAHIISVNMTADDPVLIKRGAQLEFSYSVEFVPTSEEFEDRFARYLDNDFFQHQIHWFSILNAFMMVLFLCGVVAVILIRTLRRDYAIYNLDDSELGALGIAAVDDSGWKQVHYDVFRAPDEVMILSVLLGNGVQLALLFLLVALSSLLGSFYKNRGATAKWSLIFYAVTSVVSGFVSANFYKRNTSASASQTAGTQQSGRLAGEWKVVMCLSGSVLPGAGVLMLVYLNCFSIWYSTLNVVPFKPLALIASLIVLVSGVGALLLSSWRHWWHGGPGDGVRCMDCRLPFLVAGSSAGESFVLRCVHRLTQLLLGVLTCVCCRVHHGHRVGRCAFRSRPSGPLRRVPSWVRSFSGLWRCCFWQQLADADADACSGVV
jgi:transmembrane 9 superfamily protein 3